ncbi:ABC transporter permease [Streptomyces sp. NPDC048479]|uniref:ABC transporter permease n=1 Tax=Streptomyces sp. NPDC048479 TaxID=3154725 RepID=UPI003445539B
MFRRPTVQHTDRRPTPSALAGRKNGPVFRVRRQAHTDDLSQQALDYALVVGTAIAIATVLGVALGVATWGHPVGRSVAVAVTGTFLTVPSLALLGLLIPLLGFGWTPTVAALVVYALLPITRNTIVGLREVGPAILEAARGTGMGPQRSLFIVQRPLAWPVVLTGIRMSTQLTIGIAAIAAYVAGPGLGKEIFDGLSRLGRRTPSTRRWPGRAAARPLGSFHGQASGGPCRASMVAWRCHGRGGGCGRHADAAARRSERQTMYRAAGSCRHLVPADDRQRHAEVAAGTGLRAHRHDVLRWAGRGSRCGERPSTRLDPGRPFLVVSRC